MSEIKVICPHCDQRIQVPEDMLGTIVPCPACEAGVKLPKPAAAASSGKKKIVAKKAVAEPSGKKKIVTKKASAEPSGKKKIMTKKPSGGGNTKACPYCGEKILPAAVKCKHCGEFLSEEEKNEAKGEKKEVKTKAKPVALIIAIICLIIGAGLMCVPDLSYWIYSPAFLVAFILSIITMAQKRVVGGIITMLLTIIVPIVLFYVVVSRRDSGAEETGTEGLLPVTAQQGESASGAYNTTIQKGLEAIDDAKKKWKADGGKARDDKPKKKDLLKYMPDGFPDKPEGATYDIKAIGKPPACWYKGDKHTIR